MAKQKEFSTGKIIGLLALTLVGVLVLYLVFVGIYSATYREKFDATIEGNGYVTAKGKSLYDGQGNALRLIGTNAGALFVPEGWLTVYSIGYDEGKGKNALIMLADGGTLNADDATTETNVSATGGSINLSAGTLSGTVGGSTAVAVSGTATMSGDNSYTGGTMLNGAALTVTHANALGTGCGILPRAYCPCSGLLHRSSPAWCPCS